MLGQFPTELMPLIYTSLFGSRASDAESLKRIYGDDGLQRQAIMTLFYVSMKGMRWIFHVKLHVSHPWILTLYFAQVQMAMDMEAPHLDLNLPANFPEGWVEGDNNKSRSGSSPTKLSVDSAADAPSMLNLTTSRLQQDVRYVL